ncbi:MAG: hypothetical protein K8L99_32290 [Anaerolineae bacterium]|nr:hypothetical protein [Anaerolineae bacterium]
MTNSPPSHRWNRQRVEHNAQSRGAAQQGEACPAIRLRIGGWFGSPAGTVVLAYLPAGAG